MGLLNWFKNEVRVQRASQIAKDKTEREQLSNGYQTQETKDRIKKLDSRIARNEERQKIASENNTKSNQTTKNVSYSNSTTVNNGINNHVDLRKSKKK